MIKNIAFNKFKKLVNINFDFNENINVISGTNGTCKTTLLHLISNGFQMPPIRSPNYSNNNCLRVIKAINKIANPKVEAIVRESKSYSDPSGGAKGTLFSINYLNNNSLDFRKHNSKTTNESDRYALKPQYPKGKERQSLPSKPVLYLGLSRLFPIGEIKDGDISEVSLNLPDEYIEHISQLYHELLNININDIQSNYLGDFKSGPIFNTDNPEVDSNTISSGEDNVFILIKALVSLRYYYESLIESTDTKESILLIDEFDATLHPSLQIRILEKLIDYAKKYKIQVFFTTHSLSLLEYCFIRKLHVIYLHNTRNNVIKIDEPDLLKITMYLKTQTRDQTYIKTKIPLFTEDEEGRFLFKEIFEYWKSKNKNMSIIEDLFHLVTCSIGADNLKTIFNDPYLKETTLKSICILDGDHGPEPSKCIVSLPGSKAPEQLIFDHCEKMRLENDASFWENITIINEGHTWEYYHLNVRPKIESIEVKIEEKKASGQSTAGLRRKLNKDVFNSEIGFFRMAIRNWLSKKENDKELKQFYNGLRISFYKVSSTLGIDRSLWSEDYDNLINNED
ncbi:AAA family ATPase [Pantoea vagans]|uniref:AAA family ATPase n=1 Tax=Pantoea vagans TaxID=470934 RepID=UPI003514A32E